MNNEMKRDFDIGGSNMAEETLFSGESKILNIRLQYRIKAKNI